MDERKERWNMKALKNILGGDGGGGDRCVYCYDSSVEGYQTTCKHVQLILCILVTQGSSKTFIVII